jgi:hypothetical protein
MMFRQLARRLMFRTIHEITLMIDRSRRGREPKPSAAVLDSQSVKAPAAQDTRGYDGAKKIVGRKRHIAIDRTGPPYLAHPNAPKRAVTDIAMAPILIRRITHS